LKIFRKILAVGALAMVLASVPTQLAAAERQASGAGQASLLGWLSRIWGDLATWITSESVTDGGCWVDPSGGCSHSEVLPPASTAGSGYVDPSGASTEGSCWVDPNGCPHGG